MKILLASQKPFAASAVKEIRKIAEDAGHEFATLEKYASEAELIEAVKDADALIVRSDKVTAKVVEAADRLRKVCLIYTLPSPRDRQKARMPSTA